LNIFNFTIFHLFVYVKNFAYCDQIFYTKFENLEKFFFGKVGVTKEKIDIKNFGVKNSVKKSDPLELAHLIMFLVYF